MTEKSTNLQKLASKVEALVTKPAGLGGWKQLRSGDWELEKTTRGQKITFVIGYTEREDDLLRMYEMSPWVKDYYVKVYRNGESVQLGGGRKLYDILCDKKRKAEEEAENKKRRQEERRRQKEANKYDREQNKAAKKILKGLK